MRNNLLPIAKQGINTVAATAVLFVLSALFDFDFLSFLFFVATVLFAYIYRNPERERGVFDESSMLSPVDGLVTSIQEIEDNKYAYKIEIQTSLKGVGVLRIPSDSIVTEVSHRHGTRLSGGSELGKALNEQASVTFEDIKKNSFTVEHRLTKSFVSLDIDLIKGQEVRQGMRYGFALNSVTTLYIPQNFRLNITVGNQLRGSETLIGYFS